MNLSDCKKSVSEIGNKKEEPAMKYAYRECTSRRKEKENPRLWSSPVVRSGELRE